MSTLPEGFADLEPYVEDWARPTRDERYAARLSKPFGTDIEYVEGMGVVRVKPPTTN